MTPKLIDSRLTGFRLPVSMSQIRSFASRQILPIPNYYEDFRDVLRNMVTRAARATVYYVDAIADWESEGGL